MNAIIQLVETLKVSPDAHANDVSYAVHMPAETLHSCAVELTKLLPRFIENSARFEQEQAAKRQAQFEADRKKREADEHLAAFERNAAAQRTPEAIDARLRQLELAAGGRRKL
jgi:hypothetical protein